MQSRILRIKKGGGFDSVFISTGDIPAINEHQILVQIKASSLNYHDYAVVSGMWGPAEDRIPMSDGAGEIIAIGENVKDFCFFPTRVCFNQFCDFNTPFILYRK